MGVELINFYDEKSKGDEIFFSDAPKKQHEEEKSRFYRVIGKPDLLIKNSLSSLNVDKVTDMLMRFNLVRGENVKKDLPIFLYRDNNKISGTVVPFYENGVSLYNICETHSLPTLSDYYQRDEDDIRNLFIMLEEILTKLEELIDNDIFYTDTNPGNFVVENNEVHLIDFDPKYIQYESSKENLRAVLERYDELVFVINRRLGLIDLPAYYPKSVNGMRKRLTKIENKVRKNMR